MMADYYVVHCNVAATQQDENGRYAIMHNMKVEISGVPRNFVQGGVQQIRLRTESTGIWEQ